MSNTLKWHSALQFLESRKVSVRCDPFTARLDCERGEPGVCNQIARGFSGHAQTLKDRPVALLRTNERRIRALQNHVAECKRLLEIAGLLEDPRMSAYTQHAREYLRRNSKGRIAVDDVLQPILIVRMVDRVGAEGIDQYVDIRKNHTISSIRSSSSA